MMRDDAAIKQAFDDWKGEALQVDMLSVARECGAKLKKVGTEWVGPCPRCGGKDRFGVNPMKKVFVCRGAAGGDSIAMVQHVFQLDFMGACEKITQRPPPRGKSKPLSEAEVAAQQARRLDREREDAKREIEEAERRARRQTMAERLASESRLMAGTLAEVYAVERGIPVPPQGWPSCLKFHPAAEYELDIQRPRLPALVAEVRDAGFELIAAWRIFLSADGKTKARVDNPKLGIGPAMGGAVQIGGVARKIAVCEGVETALAIWTLEDYKFPVWAALSTSGLVGIDLPLDVEHVAIYPDSDFPARTIDGEMKDDWMPPGMAAALKLQAKLKQAGIGAVIEEPPFTPGEDYLDVLKRVRQIEALE